MFKNDISENDLANIYYDVFCNSKLKHTIYNIYNSKNKTIFEMFIDNICNKEQIEQFQYLTSMQFRFIDEICKLLKLKHCQDTEKIIKKTLISTKINPFLEKHYENLCTIFNYAKPLNLDDEIKKNQTLFYLLKHIFEKWSGITLKSHEKDGHSKSSVSFKLYGYDFYSKIKEKF